MTKVKLTAVLAALLTILAGTAARAATYTVISDVNAYGDFTTGLFDNNLPAFDSALGTLTAVDVDVDAYLGPWAAGLTAGGGMQPVVIGSSAFVSMGTDGCSDYTIGCFVYQSPVVYTTGDGYPDFPSFDVTGGFDDDPSLYVDNSPDMTVEVVMDAFCVSNCDASLYASEDISGDSLDGTVWTTFTYQPSTIPEPPGMALMVLGLAGLAVTRRRSAWPKFSGSH